MTNPAIPAGAFKGALTRAWGFETRWRVPGMIWMNTAKNCRAGTIDIIAHCEHCQARQEYQNDPYF